MIILSRYSPILILALFKSTLIFHFVEAVTRCYGDLGCYDSGIFHALPQDPSYVRTKFTGSCRDHIDDVIIHATNSQGEWRKKIDGSSLDVSLETVFIVHGFQDTASAEWVTRMRDAFLTKGNYNVFTVNWSHAAQFPYEQAVANTYLVSKQLSIFIEYLERVHGLSPISIHIVGHSLGAQIAGNAGNDLERSHLGRISGLDPAEPFFGLLNDTMRLDASDAIFVDVIHTDGEALSGFHGYGGLRAQGHVDFYLNGGVKQPGCNAPNAPFGILPVSSLQDSIACSHVRATDLFTSSMETNLCRFSAHPCSSWEYYDRGNCTTCPGEGCPTMGFQASNVFNGSFYLTTSSEDPFCGLSFVIDVTTTSSQRHSYGRLMIRLNGNMGKTNQTDFSRSNRHNHESESERHVITVTSYIGDIVSAELEFRKGRGLSSLGTSDDLEIASVSVFIFNGNQRGEYESSAAGSCVVLHVHLFSKKFVWRWDDRFLFIWNYITTGGAFLWIYGKMGNV